MPPNIIYHILNYYYVCKTAIHFPLPLGLRSQMPALLGFDIYTSMVFLPSIVDVGDAGKANATIIGIAMLTSRLSSYISL